MGQFGKPDKFMVVTDSADALKTREGGKLKFLAVSHRVNYIISVNLSTYRVFYIHCGAAI